MAEILVTGAGGFIGKNLVRALSSDTSITVWEFTRENSLEDLEEMLLRSDCIYHLAGEVRPQSSDEAFRSANVTLTENIVDILEKNGKKTPIYFLSSIHAELLKNVYGKTKRESEKIIEKYVTDSGAACCICRLPHVFGDGCKPNYNSVVTTWIYNSLHDLNIDVFDRSMKMRYVYVHDLVQQLLEQRGKNKNADLYREPRIIYETTLGDVVDAILEFKENIGTPDYSVTGDAFKEKLFRTYKTYWRERERR